MKLFHSSISVVFLSLVGVISIEVETEPFKWGVATAAYQIEGAATSYGRGPSIWDTFSALPGKIANGDNGMVADDSYHNWETDVQLIKGMGLNAYRFSISWTRILPEGAGALNQEGISFYNKFIDRLVELNIEPYVTIYHWDLPQALEDRYGGWLSTQIEQDFAAYADVLFRTFGDRVKKWITVNEPWTFCYMSYVTGSFAPGRCSDRSKCTHGDSATEGYIAAHNVLNAHAAAVDLYRNKYQVSQKGYIGITVNMDWAEPYTDKAEDMKSAERCRQFQLGWFMDPIVFGRYPPAMIENVGSRLPRFTPAQSKRLKGSFDFIGLNHYATKYTLDKPMTDSWFPAPTNGWYDDMSITETFIDVRGNLIGPQGDSPWLHVVPWGFYNLLKWVKNRYNNPLIYITENGCDVPNESKLPLVEALQDTFRINYYSRYLHALDQAIFEGSNIRGYFAWSLLDNFEWADGYNFRFGLHYVNYTDPARPRYPKASAKWYAQYIKTQPYALPPSSPTPSTVTAPTTTTSTSSSSATESKYKHVDVKESYAYTHVLGPGNPIFGAYGTGF